MKSIQEINALRTHLSKIRNHAYADIRNERYTCGPETCFCTLLGGHVHMDGPARVFLGSFNVLGHTPQPDWSAYLQAAKSLGIIK